MFWGNSNLKRVTPEWGSISNTIFLFLIEIASSSRGDILSKNCWIAFSLELI